jgi:hypothetical protein
MLMMWMAMIMSSGSHIICITVAFVLKWLCFVVCLDGGYHGCICLEVAVFCRLP